MKFKFSKNILLQYILFFINPFLGLLASLTFMIKRSSKVSYIALSLSLSLIFVYFPLMYDTSSNFYATLAIQYEHELFSNVRLYNVVPLFLNNILDIQFMSLIFIYTTFCLILWFSVYTKYKAKVTSNAILLYLLVYVWVSIIYRDIMDLNRFYLAMSFFFLFLYLYDNNKLNISLKKMAVYILFLFLAITTHISSLIFLLLFVLSFKKFSYIFYIIYPILMIIIGLYSQNVFIYFFQLPIINNIEFLNIIQGYFDTENKWGGAGLTLGDYLLRLVELPLIFLIYIKGYSLIKNQRDHVIEFILLLAGLVFIFVSYKALYERYSIAFFIFSSLIIYKSIIKKNKINFSFYAIILLFILRFLIINVLMFGKVFTNDYNKILSNQDKKIAMMIKPFYYPTMLLLNIKDNGYSNIYIKSESTRGRKILLRRNINPAIKE